MNLTVILSKLLNAISVVFASCLINKEKMEKLTSFPLRHCRETVGGRSGALAGDFKQIPDKI